MLAVALAGCGGHGAPKVHQVSARTRDSRSRDIARLAADVEALRAAAAPIHGNTLMGSPRLQHLTARFLHDVNTSSLDDRTRNRQIDFAVAVVAGTCGQCFQQLEADRPIPAIAGQ